MKKLKNCLRLVTVACVVCFAMTGCGNNQTSTSGNNTTSTENNKNNNVVEDVVDNAGNAVEDVANGVGNAVEDLVGNGGFNNYKDAHDYFLETMGAYHSDATFELRDENEDLNDYQEGSKGYHFSLYDTSKNEKGDLFGEFYVDATSGTIYKKGENGEITEYPTTMDGANSSVNGATTENGNATGNTNNSTTGTNNSNDKSSKTTNTGK